MGEHHDRGLPSHHRDVRRALLRAALGVGLGLPLVDLISCPPRHAAAQGDDPKTRRPQSGDRFVFLSGERVGQVISVADLVTGSPPVMAYPMDPHTGLVRDGSRLNQVLLIRLPPADLAEETRTKSADGIVAYSAVCTHAGCDISLWRAETKRFRCPCHESEFDPGDAGRVVGGPAPRRLPGLPVKVVDGVVVAGGSFSGRPGFQGG